MLTTARCLDIGLAPDVETFERSLVNAAADLGFGLAAGVLVRGRLASRRAAVRPFGNTPSAFLEVSRTVDVAIRDPLLTTLLAKPGAVAYDQHFYAQSGAGQLWDMQSPFDYREGMAVSIHALSHAEVFTFGVDGPALPKSAAGRAMLEGALRLICAHAQAAAQRLYFPAVGEAALSLDRSEVEALRWAMDGVSVWDTGDKMRISNSGVEQLLVRAQRRLGASSKAGAVLRAIEGGLIDP